MVLKLYRLPGSHYCERAEALLQLKGISYERVTISYRDVGTRLPRETGADRVPALKLDDGSVVQWRGVPRFIERAAPTPRLYPEDPVERAAVDAWEEFADLVLGHAVRRLGYWEMRDNPEHRRRFFRVRGVLDDARSTALLTFLMAKYGATEWQREMDEEMLAALAERIARALADGEGEHLVGDALTAADVAVAILLYPISDSATARRAGHESAWRWVRATREQLKPRREEKAPPSS